jgi:NAD(P)H-nitrite reductase large subunit
MLQLNGVVVERLTAECDFCYLQRIIKQAENAEVRYQLIRARKGQRREKGFQLMFDGKKICTFRTVPKGCICNCK